MSASTNPFATLRARLTELHEPEQRNLLRAVQSALSDERRRGLLHEGLSRRLRVRIREADLLPVLRFVSHALTQSLGLTPAPEPARSARPTPSAPIMREPAGSPMDRRDVTDDRAYWTVRWSRTFRRGADLREQRPLLIRADDAAQARALALTTLAAKPGFAALLSVEPFVAVRT